MPGRLGGTGTPAVALLAGAAPLVVRRLSASFGEGTIVRPNTSDTSQARFEKQAEGVWV